jgi:5,10-methylene-tetrahydrofolate dehydrogenase/methenyl tetrahydrofolate cyclohydrolase
MNYDNFKGICSDVDFNSVSEKCSFITIVPMGVRSMTVYSLIENTLYK